MYCDYCSGGQQAPLSPEPEADGQILLVVFAAPEQVPRVLLPAAGAVGASGFLCWCGGLTVLGSGSVLGPCAGSVPG